MLELFPVSIPGEIKQAAALLIFSVLCRLTPPLLLACFIMIHNDLPSLDGKPG